MLMVNHIIMKVPMFIIDQALFVLMSMENIDCLMMTKIPWSMWFHAHGNAMTCVGLYHNLICHALSAFNESLQKIRKVLDECDECPNSKYAKVIIVPANEPDSNVVHYNSVELKGHSLICHIGSDCKSKLRILRAASTHYPVLRSFLRCVYSALNSHKNIASLDEALHRGDFNSLMRDFEITFDDLFSNEVNLSHELESSFAKCRELSVLDELSKQLIQRAKAFQTIVRLGTYTNKVPSYNLLKACKGNMFFLPLPLDKTLETLDGVEGSLANPELYIIVNSKPTKGNVVWRSLVDVNQVKAATKMSAVNL